MPGIHDFWLFVLAGLALNITPGPDTLYIVGRSVAQGRRAGIVSAMGIGAGSLVHTTAAAVGLSVLLARLAGAFALVRCAGAAYLIYLGFRMLLASNEDAGPSTETIPSAPTWTIFRQAVATNILNPKVALFFLAFLPQFVRPDAPHKVFSMVLLGIVFVVNGTIWCLIVALSAAAVSRTLRRRRTSSQWLSRATGVLFVGLGVRLAR